MSNTAFDSRTARPLFGAGGAAPRRPSSPVRPLPSVSAFGELARVLHEDFDVPRERVRPDATLADLGLSQMHWWCLHEAVLETLPHFGTHPLFRNLDAIHQPLAVLARWEAVADVAGAGVASAIVRPLRAPAV